MTLIMGTLIYLALWFAFPKAWGLAHLALLAIAGCTVLLVAAS